MTINQQRLQQNVLRFLRSPSGRAALREEFDISWILCLLFALVCFVIGVVLLLTILWARTGWHFIRMVFTPGLWTSHARRFLRHPEQLVPLVAAGIIVGPQGHGLVLGSFDAETQNDLDFLSVKAQELALLYTGGSDSPEDEELVAMLHDDLFRPGRRREVPEPQAEGRRLTMFDVQLKLDETDTDSAGNVLAVCVTPAPGDQAKGMLQVPWRVSEGIFEQLS